MVGAELLLEAGVSPPPPHDAIRMVAIVVMGSKVFLMSPY